MSIDIKEAYESNGYAIIEQAISKEKINNFKNKYLTISNLEYNNKNILSSFYNYTNFPELMDILCDTKIFNFFNEVNMEVALHASSATIVSSDIEWHQDCRVGSREAGDNYIGVWVALEDISSSSGPFQLIPGSHRWDVPFDDLYPKEKFTSSEKPYTYFNEVIKKNNSEIVSFLPKIGDILFWHGHLVHRGSTPNDRHITRMAAIGHYCNLRVDGEPDSPPLDSEAHGLGQLFDTWGDGLYFKTSLGIEY